MKISVANNNRGNALISVMALLLGLAFIILFQEAGFTSVILFLGGLAFIIPGLIALLAVFTRREARTVSAFMRVVQIVCGIGGVGLGVCILVLPDVFRPLLVFLFGALLAVCGLYQLYLLARRSRDAQYPAWMMIMPLANLVGGVLMLVLPALHTPGHEPATMLITGVGMAFFGITGIFISGYNYAARRRAQSAPVAAQTPAPTLTPQTLEAPEEPQTGNGTE